MKTSLLSLSGLGRCFLWMVWGALLEPGDLFAEDEPLTLTPLRYELYDLTYGSVGFPHVDLPDFEVPAGSPIPPFNVPVAGSRSTLSGAVLSVSLPPTAEAVPGPIPGTVLFNALAAVQLDATWVFEEGGTYHAWCEVDEQGDSGDHFLDEAISLSLPLTGRNPDVLQMGFGPSFTGDLYTAYVEFTTGADAGFLSGKMRIIFSSDGDPIQVDTLEDGDDGDYGAGEQTLREAMKRAMAKEEEVVVPVLVEGAILLEEKLVCEGTNPHLVTVVALAGNVTLRPEEGGEIQVLTVAEGSRLEFFGIGINGYMGANLPAVENAGWLRMERCGFVNIFGTFGVLHTKPSGTTILRDCIVANTNLGGAYRGVLINEGTLEAVNCLIAVQQIAVNAAGPETRFDFCTLSGNARSLEIEPGKTVDLYHCVVGREDKDPSEETDVLGNLSGLRSGGYNVLHRPGSGYQTHQRDIVGKKIGLQLFGASSYILPWSPAINKGDPDFDPADYDPPLDKDVLGRPRPAGAVDIGAFEAKNSAEYKALLLEMLLDNDGQGAGEDVNGNGTSDLLDVLTGIDPGEGVYGPPPVVASPAASPAAAAPEAPDEPDILATASEGEPFAVIELRLDERMDFGEFTLQTSADLQSWQDRATYRGLGAGQGFSRTAVDGAELEEAELSGYIWILRERVPWDDGALHVRLRGQLSPPP